MQPESSAPKVDRCRGRRAASWSATSRPPRRRNRRPTRTRPSNAPSVLTADTVSNNATTGVLTATGHVEISTGRRRLLADEVRYDRRTGKMFAKGNVVLIEPIRRRHVRRRGRGHRATSRRASSRRSACCSRTIPASRPTRRRAATATSSSSIAPSTRPARLCDEGEGGPAVADQGAAASSSTSRRETVTYRDARLEMFGAARSPTRPGSATRHPGVTRQSGFLTPTFGSTSELGLVAQVPYYYVIDQSSDATIAPIFTQNGGTVLAGEYRRLHSNGYTQLAGAGTYAVRDESDVDSEQGKGFRGYFRGFGGYGVSDHSQAGFDLYLSSDNTFLDRYQIGEDDVLRNRVFLEGFENAQLLVAQRLLLPGPAPVRRPGHDPDRPAPGRDPDRQRTDALGLLLHRRFQHAGADAAARASTHGACPTASAGRCPMSARSATSTASTSASAATSTTPRATRRRSARRAARTPSGRVLPRITADWSWPLADLSGRLGARGRADGQRQPRAHLRQHPQDPQRGQLGLRVRRDQPVRAQPLSRASTGSTPVPGSPTACASAR